MHLVPSDCKLSLVVRSLDILYYLLVEIEDVNDVQVQESNHGKDAFAVLKDAQKGAILPELNRFKLRGPSLLWNWIVESYLSPSAARFKQSETNLMEGSWGFMVRFSTFYNTKVQFFSCAIYYRYIDGHHHKFSSLPFVFHRTETFRSTLDDQGHKKKTLPNLEVSKLMEHYSKIIVKLNHRNHMFFILATVVATTTTLIFKCNFLISYWR